jgi:1-acyl-sn-glycerol-3-phosphate acyltransferase
MHMALEGFVASSICGFARVLTGVRALWRGNLPDRRQRVYFANHRSHVDFVLIWAALPPALRGHTRPVAADDYWSGGPLRRYLATQVFRSVLVSRIPSRHDPNPITEMAAVLEAGDSLIIFPEGTRNLGDDLLPFKAGIFHLARVRPDVEFVPVWIENLGRVMPKGALMPVPLLCSLTFGQGLTWTAGESKIAFLARSREALLALAPPSE